MKLEFKTKDFDLSDGNIAGAKVLEESELFIEEDNNKEKTIKNEEKEIEEGEGEIENDNENSEEGENEYLMPEDHEEKVEYQKWCFCIKTPFKKKKGNSLGMCLGVIIPVTLNIFGVILFLRLAMIVGNAGIWLTILMFTIGYSLCLLTILSISAISTNGKIKGGGAYYMISRVLGPEFGGSIGLIFFCANVFGGTMYVIGFTEALSSILPSMFSEFWWKFLFSTVLLVILTLICVIGADLFTKTGLLIFIVLMFALCFSLISFGFSSIIPGAPANNIPGYTGFSFSTLVDNFLPKWGEDQDNPGAFLDFQKVFGILFPACTGIMAGANMSGDLGNPGRSIPYGTLFATVTTFILYIFYVFLIGFTTKSTDLIQNYSVISQIALWQPIIIAGIFAATISSALTSIIGGSRILQALARDKLFPFLCFFRKGFGAGDEPVFGVLLVYILIQLALFIGNLNTIAPLVTMFFILAYLFTNIACFALSISKAPNFRPKFKFFHWSTALLGAIMCVVVMFFVNYVYALFSILILGVLMGFVHFYAPSQSWGDITRSIMYYQVRRFHLSHDQEKDHTKYWRLKVLLLSSSFSEMSSYRLLRFVDKMTRKKGGLLQLGTIKIGKFDKKFKLVQNEKEKLRKLLKEGKIKAISEIQLANSLREGTQHLLLQNSLEEMSPNTVFIGFFDPNQIRERQKYIKSQNAKRAKILKEVLDSFPKDEKYPLLEDEYMAIIRDILKFEKNLVICRNFKFFDKSLLKPPSFWEKIIMKKDFYIDIWLLNITHFEEIEATSSLVIQLGSLLKESSVFKLYHKIRLISIVDSPAKIVKKQKLLKKLLGFARVKAEVVVETLQIQDLEGSKISQSLSSNVINFEGMNKNESFSQFNGKRLPSSDSFGENNLGIPSSLSLNGDENENKGFIKKSGSISEQLGVEDRFLHIKKSRSMQYLNDSDIADHPFLKTSFSSTDFKISEIEKYAITNRVIKRCTTEKTSVIFLTLPPIPETLKVIPNHEYLKYLDILTSDLHPPVCMTYAKESVISTKL